MIYEIESENRPTQETPHFSADEWDRMFEYIYAMCECYEDLIDTVVYQYANMADFHAGHVRATMDAEDVIKMFVAAASDAPELTTPTDDTDPGSNAAVTVYQRVPTKTFGYWAPIFTQLTDQSTTTIKAWFIYNYAHDLGSYMLHIAEKAQWCETGDIAAR